MTPHFLPVVHFPKQPHQIILIKKCFRRIYAVSVIISFPIHVMTSKSPHTFPAPLLIIRIIKSIQQTILFQPFSEAKSKPFLQLFPVRAFSEAIFPVKKQCGQYGQQRRFRPVVHPRRNENVFRSRFHTGVQRIIRNFQSPAHARGNAVPCPCSTGEYQGIPQPFVQQEIVFIELRPFIVIVPVAKPCLFGKVFLPFRQRILANPIIVFRAEIQPQIHIRPNHRLQPSFPAFFHKPFQMPFHQLCPLFRPMQIHIFSPSEMCRFVHSQMDDSP